MNRAIVSQQHKIDLLFNDISSISDMRLQSEWAKYLCVLSSGFIENSVRLLLQDYCLLHSNPAIRKFIDIYIRDITNCKTSKIVDILRKFNHSWGNTFEEQIRIQSIADNEIKDALDSIVSNRHIIAHGKSIGMGYARINQYYRSSKKAINILDNIIT